MRIDTRDPTTILVVRAITAPYIYSTTITIAEDEDGNVARLNLSNLEDSPLDPIIPEGTVLAIKQPCWTRLLSGGYQIRVDHPSDVSLLNLNDILVPDSFRTSPHYSGGDENSDWKREGDIMFLKKKFRRALDCYSKGLDQLIDNKLSSATIDLYRKRCGVNIVLLRLDDAAQDLASAIAAYASSTPSLSNSALKSASSVNAWLHDHATDDPDRIANQIPRHLKELSARIKFDLGVYQSEPSYNLPLISSRVGPLTLHVDAANYVSDTEVRSTQAHGRGLFAKRAFKAGELVCAEKAFVLPGYFIQDRSSDCLLYSLGDGTASPRPGALLFKELVQKLRWNASVRKEFFALDDGGYWQRHGWKIDQGEDVPLDV